MLTENDIVETLAVFLVGKGYKINQKLTTIQSGIDLIVENDKEILCIEAKGDTSSKKHTNRYGMPFTPSQIHSHISRAVLASMQVINTKPFGPKTKVAIAIPDNRGHRNLILTILKPLNQLSIKVFLVSEELAVSVL